MTAVMATYRQQYELDMLNAKNTWGYDGDGTRPVQAHVGVTWAQQKLDEWLAKADAVIGGKAADNAWYHRIKDAMGAARVQIPMAITVANMLGRQTLVSSNPFTSTIGPLAFALDGYVNGVETEFESPWWVAFKSIPDAVADSAKEIGNSIPKFGLLIGLAVAGVVAWKVFK